MAIRNKKRLAKINSDFVARYDIDEERKRRRKKRFIRRFSLISCVIFAIFFIMFSYHLKQRAVYAEKEAAVAELTEQMEVLQLKEQELIEEIDLLNDDEYILDIARSNYFLSKKGEIIFQIRDSSQSY